MLFEQGLMLMYAGMGVVFVFLTLLVFCVSAMSKLVSVFFPSDSAKPLPSAEGKEDGARRAAAIVVALHERRRQSLR